ncbi:MAG TPA: hypothetical protein VH165_22545 [Kofleriaceae bacterium]|nr:hypothetical protein [Kofleriaceae bacterium]
MRVASWLLILCTILGGVAVFLPSIELRVNGQGFGKRTELSLYKASTDRAMVRRLLAAYRHSKQRKLGGELIHVVTPHVTSRLGHTKEALEDARDAMDTLDDLTDDDIRLAGTVFTVTLWSLIGLEAVLVALVFGQLMSGIYRRGRMVVAVLVALVVAVASAALHVACREAVWEANDEIGRTTIALAPAAYVIPIAAFVSLLAAIALVTHRRSRG